MLPLSLIELSRQVIMRILNIAANATLLLPRPRTRIFNNACQMDLVIDRVCKKF